MKAKAYFTAIGQSCASRHGEGLITSMRAAPGARERCWITDAFHMQKRRKYVHPGYICPCGKRIATGCYCSEKCANEK